MVRSFNVGVGLLVAVFVSGPLIVPACVLEIMASGRLHAGNSEIQDRVVPEGPRYHLRASVNREQNGAGTIKPMPRRDKSTTESTEWTTIFAENFESGFPGSSWDVWSPEGSSTAVWDVWTCWSGDSPNKSAGCAAGGSAAIGCDGLYPNNMDAWIVYGPFSLAYPGITAAEFSFNFTLESEENQDFFYAAASTDGDVFDYVQSSGSVAPSSYTVDLTDAFDMGNLLGQDQVWIAFLFQSDRSVAEGVGAQVDDVVVRVDHNNHPPQVVVTAPAGGETWIAGSDQGITYTATDQDSDDLTIALQYSVDDGATWSEITADESNIGTYSWTVPNTSTTQARVNVCASDGLLEQCAQSETFTILNSQPQVVVTAPAGGDNWVAGSDQGITYTATDQDGDDLTIALHYSIDGGANWLEIATNQSSFGTYYWTVPNTPTTQAKVKVCADDGEIEQCAHSEVFTIRSAESAVPVLQISALKNPGRTRSLKLLVKVSGGSGNAPTVTVGETSIEMSALGNSIYLGQYFAAANEGSVTITATDTNVHGTGSEQVTVQF